MSIFWVVKFMQLNIFSMITGIYIMQKIVEVAGGKYSIFRVRGRKNGGK